MDSLRFTLRAVSTNKTERGESTEGMEPFSYIKNGETGEANGAVL